MVCGPPDAEMTVVFNLNRSSVVPREPGLTMPTVRTLVDILGVYLRVPNSQDV